MMHGQSLFRGPQAFGTPPLSTHPHGMACRGQKVQAHRKTERFLPVGAVVTVIGELAANSMMHADAAGAGLSLPWVVRRPSTNNGQPFYITNQSVQELQASLKFDASIFKVGELILEDSSGWGMLKDSIGWGF
jgi:hypothetical protein